MFLEFLLGSRKETKSLWTAVDVGISNNKLHLCIRFSHSLKLPQYDFGRQLIYMLKVKKSADSTFQSQKISSSNTWQKKYPLWWKKKDLCGGRCSCSRKVALQVTLGKCQPLHYGEVVFQVDNFKQILGFNIYWIFPAAACSFLQPLKCSTFVTVPQKEKLSLYYLEGLLCF